MVMSLEVGKITKIVEIFKKTTGFVNVEINLKAMYVERS
jgi:hypothetical protein